MGTDTKSVPKDILAAFAVLGLAWLDRLPTVGDAVHKAIAPHLVLGNDGVWRPEAPEVAVCYPDGLSLTEALGLTLVWRWCERCDGGAMWSPIVWGRSSERGAGPSGVYVSSAWFERPASLVLVWWDEAMRLATAWLTVRRAMRPPVPWGPRDPVAEELQRVIRAASARLSPARVEQLRPAVNTTDLGRDWGSRYYRGES